MSVGAIWKSCDRSARLASTAAPSPIDDAGDGEPARLRHHHAQHLAALRAEREADADLARALARPHTRARRRGRSPPAASPCRRTMRSGPDTAAAARPRPTTVDPSIAPPTSARRDRDPAAARAAAARATRIAVARLGDDASRRRRATARATGTASARPATPARSRERRRRCRSRCRRRALRPCRTACRSQVMPERILVRPHARRAGLVQHRDRLRADAIAGREAPALHDRNAHGLEIVGRDEPDLQRQRILLIVRQRDAVAGRRRDAETGNSTAAVRTRRRRIPRSGTVAARANSVSTKACRCSGWA